MVLSASGPHPSAPSEPASAEKIVGGRRDQERGADTPDKPVPRSWARRKALDISPSPSVARAGHKVAVDEGHEVREIRFQSSLIEIGITGWKFVV